jgi:CubicO group peptidase (beta-lactamase class C family)
VGLKLRTDVPFDIALLSKYFFRQANTASEAREENAKRRAEWKDKAEARARVLYVGDSIDATSKNALGWKTSRKGEVVESNEGNLLIKFIDDTTAWYTRDQCKLQKTRSPIDGWPDAFIFFERVLGLLRGLTASLDVKQSFIETLGPYARETLRRMSQQDSETAELVEGTDKLGGKVTRIVQDALKSNNMLGVQVCVLRSKEVGRASSATCAPRVTTVGTETLVDIYSGVSNPYTLVRVSSDTLFCSFSTSKAVAAAVVHQLVDDGLISLSDPIAKHWPEFAANGKGKITIQDVLLHRSGLQAAGTEEITTDPFLCTNSKAMTALMAASTPDPATLGETHYHYLSFGWILEGLIEAVSGGKSIRDLAEKLWGLRIGLSSKSSVKDDELATLVLQRFEIPTNAPGADNATSSSTTTTTNARRPAELATLLLNPTFFNNPRIQESSIPSANGLFTARGLAEFFISSGPRLADVLKSTNETASTTKEKLLQGGAGKFRGGFMLYDEDQNSITFGHSGLGGSIAVCRRNVATGETIAVAVTLNRLQLDAKTTRLILRTVFTSLGIRVPPAFVRD